MWSYSVSLKLQHCHELDALPRRGFRVLTHTTDLGKGEIGAKVTPMTTTDMRRIRARIFCECIFRDGLLISLRVVFALRIGHF